MLTKLILKISLLAAVITVIYCLLTNVSITASLSRSIIVFAGFYAILVAFFISLRLIFEPVNKQDESLLQQAPTKTETEGDKQNTTNTATASEAAELVAVEAAGGVSE